MSARWLKRPQNGLLACGKVAGDALEALEHRRRGADAGPTHSEDAEESLGFLYLHGKTVPKDLHKAHEYFQRAVEHGSVNALFNLGASYQFGTTPDGCVDIEKAKRLCLRAAALGHALARSNLAQLLCIPSHGGTVTPATIRKGMLYFQANIDEEVLGAHQHRYDLACVHTNTNGFDQFHNFERAAELFEQAYATDGPMSGEALFWHRNLILKGRLQDKDMAKGIALLKRASQRGSDNADRILALLAR